jgi:26S proteasome non-ATPase regulatory subunit 9
MDVVEKKVHEMFANQAQNAPSDPSTITEAPQPTQALPSRPLVLEVPFAKVNSVVDGSPADSAGLKAGDEIRNFGYVNRSNHDNLRRVADCVQSNEGVSIHFHIMHTFLHSGPCNH